jgi:hypothetical protein
MAGRARRRIGRGLVVLVLSVALLPAASGGPGTDLSSYRGLGAWVDIFDRSLYGDPEGTVAMLSSHGVETLFLQSATYRFPGPIRFPDLAGRFLDAAHAAGMRVVAWYVPDFADLRRDYEWSVAAMRFASPAGQRFDSFALDIEVTAVADPEERASRLVELSRQLRAAAGPGYALGAITPSPLRSPGYWPVFPDVELAQLYDVYLPMAYWSYSAGGERGAYDYIDRSAQIVRTETGRPDLPIHMIGGLASGAEADESRGFVSAVNANRLLGASLYDVATTGAEDWGALAQLRFEQVATAPTQQPEPDPRGPTGLALGQDLGTYGSIAGAERRFDERVTFDSPSMAGAWELDLEALGSEPGVVLVNGERAGAVPAGGGTWGTRTTVPLPDDLLRDDADNQVTVEFGRGRWAVREVTASAAPLPIEDRGAHGAIPTSDPGRRDRVTYAFQGSAAPMSVTVRAFDAGPGEIAVSLDGVTVGWLPPTTPRVWGRAVVVVVEPRRAGEHRLTFDATGDAEDPWAVRLDAAAPTALV